MKTRKFFGFMLMTALMGGLSLGAVSCKSDEDSVDDEKISTVTVESGLVANGVSAEMKSAVVELPVKCDGEWFALLGFGEKDTPDWVRIQKWQAVYEGNQTLLIAFDQNLTGYDRKTTLTLANSAGQITKVPIIQTYTFDGKAPDNSSGQVFANKGVGYGMDYNYLLDTKSIRYRNVQEQLKINSGQMDEKESTKFNALAVTGLNNLFNISQIEKLMIAETGKPAELQASAYVETPIELADLEISMLDSALIQDKTIKFSLQLGISLGPIEFEARAAYGGMKKESRMYVDYNLVRNAPMYDIRMSPAEISTYAALPKNRMYDEDALDAFDAQVESQINKFKRTNKRTRVAESELNAEGLTEEQQNIIDGMYLNDDTGFDFGGVYSTGFSKAYSRLIRAISLNVNAKKPLPINETLANQVCQQLNDLYGPFIIARAQFGGALVLTARVDTMRLEGKVTATGLISGEALGMFKVSGDFSYTEDGFNHMRNIGAKFHVMGGDANPTADALANLLASSKPDCREEWFDAMSHWWQSMKADDGGSHAEPISYSVVPIWTIFTEPEIADYVRKWFLNKYQDRGIYEYLDIIDEKPNAKTAVDILGNTYDFDMELDPTGIPVSGDADHPLTVEQADSIAGIMDAKRLAKSLFYVKGRVVSVGAPYTPETGVASFTISDNNNTDSAAYMFRVPPTIICPGCSYLGLTRTAWKDSDPQIAVGDEVIVYGQMEGRNKFVTGKCGLYMHNGKVAK